MTSPSSENASPSSPATSGRAARSVYQRKVRLTMTRAEAELARMIFLRAATDPHAAEIIAPKMHPSTYEKRSKNLWRKIDRKIDARDRAMAAKEPGEYRTDDTEDEVDVPLRGL